MVHLALAGDHQFDHPVDTAASDLGVYLEADQVEFLVLEFADSGRVVEEVLFERGTVIEMFSAVAAGNPWVVVAASCTDYSPLRSAAVLTVSVSTEPESFEHYRQLRRSLTGALVQIDCCGPHESQRAPAD